MKTRYKIIIGCGLAVLVLAGLSISVLFYYYTHPSKVKSLAEEWVSSTYGVSLTIQKLSYSRNPLKIRLEGVRVGPGPEMKGLSLDIPLMEAEIALAGRWGRRTLILSNVRISGFSSRLSENPDFSGLRRTTGEPSSNVGLVRKLFLYLAFRNLRLQSAEVSGGPVSALLGERSFRADHIQASLQIGRPVELTCDVQAEWPSRAMKLSLPHVSLKADKELSLADPEVGGTLMVKEADFESPMASIRDLTLKTVLRYRMEEKKLTFSNTELVPGLVSYRKGRLREVSTSGLRIAMKGEFGLGDQTLHTDSLYISLGDKLRFDGSLDAEFGKEMGLDLKIVKAHFFPDRLRSLLPGEMLSTPVRLTGPIGVTGTIEGSPVADGSNKWSWRGELHVAMKENHLSFTHSHLKGDANLTGEVKAKGTFPDMTVSGKMRASGMGLSGTELDLKPFSASFAFSGSYPKYNITNLTTLFPEIKQVYQGKEFKVRNLRMEGRSTRVDAVKKTLYTSALRLDSSLLKNLEASLSFGPKEGHLKLNGNDTGLLEAFAELKMLPPGWNVSGRDRIDIDARLGEGKNYVLSGRMKLEGVSFQNREETCLGEGLSVNADLKGKIGPSFSRIEAQTTLRADQGELLYDRFYLDLKRNPFGLEGNGLYNVEKKEYRLSGVRLGLKSLLQVQVSGELGGEKTARKFDVSVKIPGTPVGPAFDALIKEPFQTEKPILGSLEAGGSLSGGIRLKGKGPRWSAKGRLLWKEGVLSIGKKSRSLEGINLSLPLWFRNHDRKDSMVNPSGVLSIKRMNTGFLPVQPLKLALVAGPNTMSTTGDTILKIPGGKVRIGPLVTKGWGERKTSCDTSLALDSVSLEPLLEIFSTQGFGGTLTGGLDSVHIENGIMRTTGKLEAEVFGGSILFSNIGATGLFDSTPVFKLDALWRDLDLSKLTTGTGFGKIQGILTGRVKKLELSGRQPQRFDLLVETVKKKGIPQRISVEAVDHIAELGGGQSPFVGAAGIFASLFKEFPYKKIGVHAALENDVFRINGTIREKGKEYLVKRSFISGVNVINQNPDNRVSFKDMVKRLKRVISSKSGPVVR